MSTRRRFLKQVGALVIPTRFPNARAQTSVKIRTRTGAHINAAIRRDETLLRYQSHGNAWHMSWGHDNRQYVSWASGLGFPDNSSRVHLSRMLTITGDSRSAAFQEIDSYPMISVSSYKDAAAYHSYGTLALDGSLYQFLSTYDRPLVCNQTHKRCNREFAVFCGTKLIYSPDGGKTWHNQNRSTPVLWESWDDRSRNNMLFWDEDQHTFSMVSVLQMGRNYEHNRDGYVYIYSPNGMTEGTMNELVMLRVAKSRILDRTAYQFFAGLKPNGAATWSKDISARKAVHRFSSGWVNQRLHPYSWQPSVIYNAPLGLYLMANWGTANGTGVDERTGVHANNTWFVKPSYLGLWMAHTPWGPWEQFHEETAWMPAGDAAARCFQAQISPKWIAADGKSFWLVWSDYKITDGEAMREMLRGGDVTALRKYMPHYLFNTQRVDLVLK